MAKSKASASATSTAVTTQPSGPDIIDTPVVPPKNRAPVNWTAPVLRAQKMHLLVSQLMARAMSNQAMTTSVLSTRLDPDTWQEMAMIQAAVLKRCQQQHQEWVEGCAQIAQDYNQLKLANTLSKHVEQEYNIVAQFGALLSDQMADWAGLMENIQVDYAYWISQKQVSPAA